MLSFLSSRARLSLGLVLLLVVSSLWVTDAQQPEPQPKPASSFYFTGKAFTLESADLRVTRMGFEAGARANWHTHIGGQLLFAESGPMRAQIEGQLMKDYRQGESVYLPGGVPHWHGAGPDLPCTHVAINFPPSTTRVMEKVTDAQYNGDAGRREK